MTAPINQTFKPDNKFHSLISKNPKPFVPRYDQFHYPTKTNYRPMMQGPPPRPNAPKPHEKMDIDHSVQTRNVNYMNRPRDNNPFKRKALSEKYAQKQQRLFHTETCNDEVANYEQVALENLNEDDEVNFMMDAYPAYHI